MSCIENIVLIMNKFIISLLVVSCAISFALSLNESLVITTIPSDVEISEAITENYEFLNTESVTEYIYDDEFKILDEAKQLHTRRSRRTTIKPLSIRDRLNKYTRKTKIRVTKRKRTRPTPGHNIDVDSNNSTGATRPMHIMLTTKPPLTQQEGANLNSSEDYYYYYEDIEHDAIIYRKNSPISDASLLKLQPRDYISQLDLVQQANKTTVSTNSTGIPLNKSTNQTDSKINTFLDRLEDLAKNSSSLPSLGQENISNTTQNSTQFVDKLVANKTENGNNTLIFIESGISELLEHAGGTNHHGNLNKTVNSTESKIPTFLDRLEGINETILEILAVTQASIPNVSTSTETLDQKTTNAFTTSSVEVLNEEYSTLVQESSVDTTEEEIVITTTDSPLETTTKSSTESLATLLNQIDAINNNLLVSFVESIKISDEDLGLNSSTSQLNALSTHVNRISEILTKLSSKDPFYSLNFRAVEKESEKVPILTGIMKQKLQVADIITRVRQNNKLFGINGNKIDASAPLDNIKKLIQKIRVQ